MEKRGIESREFKRLKRISQLIQQKRILTIKGAREWGRKHFKGKKESRDRSRVERKKGGII